MLRCPPGTVEWPAIGSPLCLPPGVTPREAARKYEREHPEDVMPSPWNAIGETTIPDRQRSVHMASEAVAVFAVAPFMFWLAFRKDLPGWARAASGLIGAGTLLIDGYLLLQYSQQEQA